MTRLELPVVVIPDRLRDALLDHGAEYEPRPRAGTGLRKMADKACFTNSACAAVSRPQLAYCEGIALTAGGFWLHHAWNVDADDRAIDRTWREPGQQYVGVIVERAEVANAIARSRWFGGMFERDDAS